MLDQAGIEALVVAAACIGVVYYVLLRFFPSARRQRYRGKFKPRPVDDRTQQRPHDPLDATDQLRAVMSARFSTRKVMNASEYRVFRVVESEVRAFGGGCRVFAQTALGEIIMSEDRRAHSAINSKRTDVVVIGPTGLPLIALEYQGTAHYQKDAAARDAVKKEALRKAGVEYIEVREHHTDEETARLIRGALTRAIPSRSNTPSPAPSGHAPTGPATTV